MTPQIHLRHRTRGDPTCTSKASPASDTSSTFQSGTLSGPALRCCFSTIFPCGNSAGIRATFADPSLFKPTIPSEPSPETPSDDLPVATPILLHFYEDDIVIPYHTYDRYLAAFQYLRIPLSARHLAALHTFPSSVEDFLRQHFIFNPPPETS